MAETNNGWGGKRAGAGRPKGTTKTESNQRKQRQVRAHDDEWELIKKYAEIVKKDHARAERMMTTK